MSGCWKDPETLLFNCISTARHWRVVLIASSVSRLSGHNCSTEFTHPPERGWRQRIRKIVPDAATCPCLSCGNEYPRRTTLALSVYQLYYCGPRFTIIRAMPYDRPFTVMAAFPLCPACDKEYRDPPDRRFHAQPVACPECGPHLEWVKSCGEHAEQEAVLQAAIAQLKMGNIVAIKGLADFILPAMHVTVTRWRHFGRANIARRNRWRSCCQWLTVYQTLRASCLPHARRADCAGG